MFFHGVSYQTIRSFGMCEVGLILRRKPVCAVNLLPPLCNASGLSPDPKLPFIMVVAFTLRR